VDLSAAQPLSADDFFVGLLVAEVLLLLGLAVWRHEGEWLVFTVALAGKFVAGVATVAIFAVHYISSFVNDNVTYHYQGVEHAMAIRAELGEGELLEHLVNAVWIGRDVNSTVRFSSASGVFHALTADSFLGATFICGALGFVGQLLLYRTFVSYYPERWLRPVWWAGVLFWPSLVLWSAGLLKESFGFLGLGMTVWGVDRFVSRGRLTSLMWGGFGAYVLMLYRPQILLALFAAIVPWMLAAGPLSRHGLNAERRGGAWRRGLIGAGIFFGAVAMLVFGAIDPRYSLAALAGSIGFVISVSEQQVFAGSNLAAPLIEEVSAWGVLRAWPAALVVALFRPFLWEAPGAFGLLAAVENTVLLALLGRGLWLLVSREGVALNAVRSPLLLASVTFVAVMGLTVAIAQINLGTVSRYRIPLLPFTVAAAAIIEKCARAPRSVGELLPASVPAARRIFRAVVTPE